MSKMDWKKIIAEIYIDVHIAIRLACHNNK